ncbi:DUF7286 family protein [Haloglomus halophilum]|uniref:DUF7286 family protein n=1 Tax=Haloglomus halophilum TaxID=2962672 RepID=UPI0020C9942A|nr:hypothetical protein [Haloglomus halophilum]
MVNTLGTDDRARVPFALVGVVLLVTSTAFHASLGAAPAVREPATEAALERAGAAAVPALRVAVRQAARAAAADPVLTTANTTAGRALNDSHAFRDALRLRIYLSAATTLDTVHVREDSVRASTTLPAVEDDGTRALRRTIERVELRRTGPNGTRLQVRLRNVSLRATRDGRVVTRESFAPSVTVTTPVLAIHDRTTRYQRRLDARTLSPESAGARLTFGTYLAAYGRGTAQWAGAPVSNVLANRHLALATDAAVYDAQARTFGARDPAWKEGFATTAARTLGQDAVALGFGQVKQNRSRGTARAMDTLRRFLVSRSRQGGRTAGPFEDEPVTVDVGASADSALAAMLRQPTGGTRNLTDVLRASYTVRARLATTTRRVGTSRSGQRRPASPGDWRLVDHDRQVDRRSREVIDNERAEPPDPQGRWHRLSSAHRRVIVRETVVRHWRDGNRTVTTSRTTTTRNAVAIEVLGRHTLPDSDVPQRPVRPIHEPGGVLDGPNLGGVAERATTQLVAARGGYDRLAARATADAVNTTAVRVVGRRPPELERWVVRDLTALNRRVRNVSVRTSRRDLGTLAASPAADLAATLRQQRRPLLDPPRTYDGVSDRARIAVRAAYLDRVIDRLEDRSDRRKRARRRLNDSLVSRGLPSLARIERQRAVAANATAGRVRPSSATGSRFVPDTTPNRLALTAVSRPAVGLRGGGTVRPLAARNLNVFTLPYDDVASFVRGGGRETVSLRTAARTLQAAAALNDTHPANDTVHANGSLLTARGHLEGAVRDANGALRERARGLLRREGMEGATRRRAVVASALDRWDTPSARALALLNGSAASAIAETAVDRNPRLGRTSADRLELLLRAELRQASEEAAGRVPRRPTERTGRLVRDLIDVAATEAVKATAERGATAARERLYEGPARTVPAGLPVLPPVQPWYATVNVWYVRVRGVHPSLVVRANGRGRPRPPLAYERDGRSVRLDVDDDGTSERLGRATRVSFDIETTVLVVVPPGGRGVGDTNGKADERTGWPAPRP